jgi:very-short-patch-repair endonuclease
MSPAQVAWLLKCGTWRRVHRSVFVTFTGPLNRTTQLWAAVLCAGRGAYLSHETAAELNQLTDTRAPEIHLTIPAGRRVSPIKGVVIHVSSQRPMIWRPPDIPPYTVAAKTVIDLVQLAASEDAVIALVTLGFGRRQLGEGHLRAVGGAHRKLRWRRELDEIITQAAGGAHSPLEFRYDRDVQRAHGLPEPVKQARFRQQDGRGGYRDRYYPGYGGLVVELDGLRFHPAEQRGRDTERDNQAAVTGATLRYGWDAVTRQPCATARQLAEALRHRGWTGSLTPCSPRCPAVRDSVAAPGASAAASANAAASSKAPADGGKAPAADGGEAEATAGSSKAAAGRKGAVAYPRISSSTAPVSVRSGRTTRAPAAARTSAG